MLAPYQGRVFDPCCGSGGMFVQSEKFVEAHGGHIGDISVYGQESNHTTWRLAKMNLAIRGIDANLGKENADSFHRDLHPDLKADYVLANPPFNDSDWRGDLLKDDKRWQFGTPPSSNANFAWVQHFIYHLAPRGIAGFVLAQVSLSSESQAESDIRRGIIENDLVDCIVTLPGRLFYSTPIPVCLWFLARAKNDPRFRDRRGQTLFIDASKMGIAETRTHSFLPDTDIRRISSTYHSWREGDSAYRDVPGFCQSVTIDDIRKAGYSLFPARYITASSEGELPVDGVSRAVRFDEGFDRYMSTFTCIREALKEMQPMLSAVHSGPELLKPSRLTKFQLADVLERSDERLGVRPEPEILTVTEKAGLVLQRERFAKRVATEDTSKYKVVRRSDIVYNPYLLWAGAIDQCWVVDEGVTSPAYEVLRVKPGFDPTLVGNLVKSAHMIRLYDGISVGTVQRRRRAPVERFLDLEVEMPDIEFQREVSALMESMQEQVSLLRSATDTVRDLLSTLAGAWLEGSTSDRST